MMAQTVDTDRFLLCPGNAPVKYVTENLAPIHERVYVENQGEVRGVILDFPSLVESHSFYNSPFPIGSLLKNATTLYLLSQRRSLSSVVGKWIELRNPKGKIIAWLHNEEIRIN